MNQKTKRIIGVGVGIVVVIGISFGIKNYISSKIENVQQSTNYGPSYTEAEAMPQTIENSIRGAGTYSSFNIAKLNVGENLKVVKQLVEDGSAVNAQANVLLVNDGYENSYVKAPVGGLFYIRQSDGATSYSVYDIQNSGILVQVGESDAAKVVVGQKVIVHVTALNKDVEGSVVYISKVAENGNFSLRVNVPYSEELRFGYNASVRVITQSIENALCVPYDAVFNEGEDMNYVIKAKYLKQLQKGEMISEKMKTRVTIGATDNNVIQILDGLKEGDKVLVGDYQ
ncbi:MAG: hypothetical protein RSF69_02270 [Erysipelotrichaceae bacterium]